MPIQDLSNTRTKEDKVWSEVKQHSEIGFQETDRRATGKNRIGSISFNEADELFRSWLDETTWPYDALLFDPRIFTFIFEKTSRLIANKPKGFLTPRQDGDLLSAHINNALLDFQWDNATFGGSMIAKWAIMDMNCRKYGAAFALAKWRYEEAPDGRVLFDGPEFKFLNNRDCAHDLSGTAIENCNWFQVREYVSIQELKRVNDAARSGPIYKNLDKLKFAIAEDEKTPRSGGGDSRSTNWLSRNRSIAGLELDPVGKDFAFKTIEIVTEYRRDRWITFAPKHGVIIRDIENPYKNNEIPVIMLRYYAIDDDLYGISEIEPVKGIQKAINALLCQYVDEINQKLYTPIAVGPGVRQHTLEWGKGARWIMNNPMTDFRLVESRSNAAQYFNNTYSALVASMINALGESSLGVSNIQPYQQDKTATEVKALQLQRNARDNYNQIFLAEAIKRQYMLWHSMNQVMLFTDPDANHYIIRLSGDDAIRYFQQTHLDEMTEPTDEIDAIETLKNAGMPDTDIQHQAYSLPKHPVNIGSKKEPKYTSKMQMEPDGKNAILYVEPADLKGTYNFSIDVVSMGATADQDRRQARQAAISMLSTNPNITQMLLTEGVKPKFKELFVQFLEDLGLNGADRFFEKADGQAKQELMGALGAKGGDLAAAMMSGGGGEQTGIPGGANPNEGGEASQSSPFSQLMKSAQSGQAPAEAQGETNA